MKTLNALNILNDLCASQRGLFTSAQAQALGVDRMAISRLVQHGQIECLTRGVYRSSAAPRIREEDIYADWLSLRPKTPAYERLVNEEEFVASLNTAAWLMKLGELKPNPATFSYPTRRQSRSKSIKFIKRTLPMSDIAMVAGIPTTTPERTVLDLLDYGEDLSLVSSVLADAQSAGHCNNLEAEINARAAKCGFSKQFNLYEYLRKS
jgi:predicted transcriptional regulator of viral defense system